MEVIHKNLRWTTERGQSGRGQVVGVDECQRQCQCQRPPGGNSQTCSHARQASAFTQRSRAELELVQTLVVPSPVVTVLFGHNNTMAFFQIQEDGCLNHNLKLAPWCHCPVRVIIFALLSFVGHTILLRLSQHDKHTT